MRARAHPWGIRVRWWWHRHPVGGWSLSVAAVALLAAVPGAIEAIRPSVAATVPVVVAADDLAVGDRIGADDVVARRVAGHTVAGTPVGDPVGRVVTAPVLAGEPVVAERLAPAGVDGAAALVEPGEVAVAVPIALAAPPAAVGDHVDVLVTDGQGFGTERVAVGALVVAFDEVAVTVSLGPAEALAVADGLASGAVTLALRGPEP